MRSGCLIAIDNVLWFGRIAEPQFQEQSTRAICAFNEKLHHDQWVTISLVSIADGLTLALKER